jgi:hypothetical protein
MITINRRKDQYMPSATIISDTPPEGYIEVGSRASAPSRSGTTVFDNMGNDTYRVRVSFGNQTGTGSITVSDDGGTATVNLGDNG